MLTFVQSGWRIHGNSLDYFSNLDKSKWGFPDGLDGKELVCNAGDLGSIPGKILWRRERLPTPVFLTWRIPGTEEPGGLHSTASQTVGHNWVTNTFTKSKYFKIS